MKIIEIGKKGALLTTEHNGEFQAISCLNYADLQGCIVFDQAHYFKVSVLNKSSEITEEDRADCLAAAKNHFERNYK